MAIERSISSNLSADAEQQTNIEIIKHGSAGPSRLLSSDVKKFQDLYLKHFGQAISHEEAREELALLVRQIQTIYKPINIQQLERLFNKEVANGLN